MQRLVDRDGFVELFLADIAPRTYWVADDFDIEVGHLARGG